MKLKDIAAVLNATISCGTDKLDEEVEMGYSSDLMSDVLTLDTDNLVLLTGMVNLQAIRTARHRICSQQKGQSTNARSGPRKWNVHPRITLFTF